MILVTGAAGLSGSVIVRELGRQQIQAKALVRSRSKAPWIAELPSVQLVEGDMGEAATLHDARNRPGTHLIACADRILAPVENVIEMNVATK